MKKLALCTLILSSCVQRYDPPPLKVPSAEEWKSPKGTPTAGVSCPEPEQVIKEATFRPWWVVFNDTTLTNLEEEALKNSPTIQAAVARLEQAYAAYGISLSAMFPEITLGASATRERISRTQSAIGNSATTTATAGAGGLGVASRGVGDSTAMQPTVPACTCPVPVCVCPPPAVPAATPKVTKPSPYVNELALLPTLSYELDFWGKNWQAVESASQQIKAEEEDLQTALLLLTTSVADTYLQVRTYDAEIAILEKTIQTRQHNYDLNMQQFTAGLIDKLPVDQAKTDLESVLASIEETRRLRAITEHSLAELVGMPAPLFSLERTTTLDLPALPEIPAGVPSNMLKRRPDVRQQEYLVSAQALNVGVAKTAYFPDFTITLDYGFLSSRANQLFKWKSHTWLAAVDAVTPIFTAGQISSTIEQAIAQYKQQVASYISTVLTSFREVEDALFSVEQVKKQLDHLHKLTTAATEAYRLADKRYRMGLENYVVVVNTERTMLDSERTEIQVKRAQYSTTISLIKSLGGGWE